MPILKDNPKDNDNPKNENDLKTEYNTKAKQEGLDKTLYINFISLFPIFLKT